MAANAVVSALAVVLFSFSFRFVPAQGQRLGFECSAAMKGKSCRSVVMLRSKKFDHVPSIAEIAGLFMLTDVFDILGANNWPLNTSFSARVPEGSMVRVPVTCSCSAQGFGLVPGIEYTVQPNEYLSLISMYYYGNLITYQAIAQYNNISNPDRVDIGQKLFIPVPCSCNDTSELRYTYVVGKGETLQSIASTTGSTVQSIEAINSNVSSLDVDMVIAVPLKACSSNFSKNYTDQNLVVANGTYALSAKKCVQCICGPTDLNLYCTAGPNSEKCTGMTCPNSNLIIGSMTTDSTANGCNVTECVYDGHTAKTVHTLLENHLEKQCPAKRGQHVYTDTPMLAMAPSPSAGAQSPNQQPAPASSQAPASSAAPSKSSPKEASPPRSENSSSQASTGSQPSPSNNSAHRNSFMILLAASLTLSWITTLLQF